MGRYGNTYTATPTESHTNSGHCALVYFLSMTEAFIGVLFAGMSTSILFSKVGRIQSDAQVFFSNALCVQMSKIPSETFDNNDSVNGLGTRRLNAQPGDEKKEQGESLDGEDCDVPQVGNLPSWVIEKVMRSICSLSACSLTKIHISP